MLAIGAVASSGIATPRPAKSTSLCPLSGSDAFHLSTTCARAPEEMVSPAFATLTTRNVVGTARRRIFGIMVSPPDQECRLRKIQNVQLCDPAPSQLDDQSATSQSPRRKVTGSAA